MRNRAVWTGIATVLACVAGAIPARGGEEAPPRIVTHYMPWFAAPPVAKAYGWHWTMGKLDPSKPGADGRRPIAAHDEPIIGPYDSADPAVIEYHLLLMKTAGIDGIVVDWYGLSDLYDYPANHRNTAALFPAAAKAGLSVAVCYEDQTIPKLVEAGKLAEADRVTHAKELFAWLREHWFADPAYLRQAGRPVLLSFGYGGLTDPEWAEALPTGADAPIYLSEHHRRPVAAGAFDWPLPKLGMAAVDRFETESKDWPVAMPVAFPRFHDYYAEAGVHPGYGEIPDDDGRTFTATLARGLKSRAPFMQIATWNDWGEGTQIEPSVRYGYRDLEAIQRARREHIDPTFAAQPDDLRLPHRLFLLRRQPMQPGLAKALDEAAQQIVAGRFDAAKAVLDHVEVSSR